MTGPVTFGAATAQVGGLPFPYVSAGSSGDGEGLASLEYTFEIFGPNTVALTAAISSFLSGAVIDDGKVFEVEAGANLQITNSGATVVLDSVEITNASGQLMSNLVDPVDGQHISVAVSGQVYSVVSLATAALMSNTPYLVQMSAHAFSTGINQQASAYVDPIITIDPDFLANNLGYFNLASA